MIKVQHKLEINLQNYIKESSPTQWDALLFFIFSSVVFYTSTHCVKTLQVAGKDWEFLTRFSLPKQALRCTSFLCWQQLGWLQHAHLYQTPTVLRSCHSLFLKAATDNNTRGWDLGVKRQLFPKTYKNQTQKSKCESFTFTIACRCNLSY